MGDHLIQPLHMQLGPAFAADDLVPLIAGSHGSDDAPPFHHWQIVVHGTNQRNQS